MVTAKARLRQAYAQCARALLAGRADLMRAEDAGFSIWLPIFPVGQAARLAGMHPQTLREYDRIGLITPGRTPGGARRYSLRDVARLAQAQRLADQAINLTGIEQILTLMEENRELRRQVRRLRMPRGSSVFAAGPDGRVREYKMNGRDRRHWRDRLYNEMLALEAHHADRALQALESGGPASRAYLEAPAGDSLLEIETRRAIAGRLIAAHRQ
jgi:MerR family transcriptional regulator/heat shock protein HspR